LAHQHFENANWHLDLTLAKAAKGYVLRGTIKNVSPRRLPIGQRVDRVGGIGAGGRGDRTRRRCEINAGDGDEADARVAQGAPTEQVRHRGLNLRPHPLRTRWRTQGFSQSRRLRSARARLRASATERSPLVRWPARRTSGSSGRRSQAAIPSASATATVKMSVPPEI